MSEASLRANVPSCPLRAANYVLRHGVAGSRGETPSLPFFCRRFFSQTEKKCRNAGSVKSLIIVGREGSKPIINKSKLLYRLPPIADSREESLRAVGKTSLFKAFVPLARHRCVESPHPTKYKTISRYKFCGQIISVPTAYICCFERSKTPSQSRLTPSQLPLQGSLNSFCGKSDLSLRIPTSRQNKTAAAKQIAAA